MKSDISLELASSLTEQVKDAFENGDMLANVTPITQDLLKFWFMEPYTDERSKNFHDGQKQSILNIIYLHEILKVTTVIDIYEKVAPELLAECNLQDLNKEKYKIPKYAVKMATGTGKTWVMHALLIWQLLNARHEEETKSGRYTQNFLIVAPGLIVYDRLKDAYCGRLKKDNAERDWCTNDLYLHKDLFIPPAYRDEVFSFIQNNVVTKEDGIGRKITGQGLIALTNWHIFMSNEESYEEESPSSIIKNLLPITPGVSGGNVLDNLDRQYLRGNELEYLSDLTDLMVINDEAHHIHENKKQGEIEEVEWQKGLNKIALNKKGRFFQIDFSATPYDTVGSGKKKTKYYFPHIIVDFDLSQAMKKGLVKTLLLDKRQELTDLINLDYNAIRDNRNKVIGLSDGQRLMLRAGLRKLQILEDGFTKIDTNKHPKMLVICEDTNVTPFVESFLLEEGLSSNDVLRIDSNAKGEVKDSEWLQIKERLFNIDKYLSPKVIVSVLMLREGFDVNNICVIVPLRSTQSAILLEQTIGRGLRLMWREPEYLEEKNENRKQVLVSKRAPKSYIDMLSIIEHPAFLAFYQDLMNDGLAGIDNEDIGEGTNVTGDLLKVGLKENYQDYDLFWPFIIKEQEEEIDLSQIDINSLSPFTDFSYEQLKSILAKPGESFISQDVQVGTQFGKYTVNANLCNAQSYNEYLEKVLNIVTNRFYKIGKATPQKFPTIQVNQLSIIQSIDLYIRTKLFSRLFNPFENFNWKILLHNEGIATQHIVKEFSKAIYYMQEHINITEAIVEKIYFSTVPTLKVRERYSLNLEKTIYEKVGYPSNKGGFEKEFMEFLDTDSEVNSFIKINESQHSFASIYYIRYDGLLATYHPDFIVSTNSNIYIIETKGQDKIHDKNVRQKQLATLEWCKNINRLQPIYRMNKEWKYILLGETQFYNLQKNNATITEICNLHKVSENAVKGVLF